MNTAASVFLPFANQRTIVLTTYRRDGTPVGTPVSIAIEGQRAFFRTWDTTGKFKRIRNNPTVTIAPSTFGGQATGPALQMRAKVLDGAEANIARRALARKYPLLHGIIVPLIHRLRGNTTVHLELMPNQG
ncbi:MAG TPA: PPOX class F420-dependent oxidoreductase [Roseiflexaceae bacterium]|nr:PPOX class F420-dependent oxidoreductase [Roseiflexaceae bacterium]